MANTLYARSITARAMGGRANWLCTHSAMHRGQSVRVLAHVKVVVGTLDHHLAGLVPAICGLRECTPVPLQISKHTVVVLVLKLDKSIFKEKAS